MDDVQCPRCGHMVQQFMPGLLFREAALAGEVKRLKAENERLASAWLEHEHIRADGSLGARVRDFLDQTERLRAMVRSREWDSEGFCYWCYALRKNGHVSNCPRKIALGGDA